MTINTKNKFNTGSLIKTAILILVAFIAGYMFAGIGSEGSIKNTGTTEMKPAKSVFWTCSMHPQIRQPKPGKCPICGMDLIPVTESSDDSESIGPRELKLTDAAIKLAEIQVAPVEYKFVSTEIRMVGKIDYDETRLAYITAWIAGRLDRLFVDYTGIPVRKGDHMVYLYSPELFSAQQELLQAIKAVKDLKRSKLSSMKNTALLTMEASKEKLRLWGLTETQINEIIQRGKPTDHMTIYAPMSGIVIHKNALEGMYVKTGTRIYTIADLSYVWLKLDAYESDLEWIRYGQEVEFETEAYPGEVFKGKISFIDPVLNAKTRTVKIRVIVPNKDGRLKPEMFVHATVRTKIAAGGKVMDSALAGKWICPMHPEVIKSRPGRCDICKMNLVSTKSMGYVSIDEKSAKAAMVIPASAPLKTGKRAVVYVAIPDKKGYYEGREIVLGPRAGDYYLVKNGLKEGELVVVNGNFKIDSAIQILAKPSMMNPEGGGPAPGHQHGKMKNMPAGKKGKKGMEQKNMDTSKPISNVSPVFKSQLDKVFKSYFGIQYALSRDNFKETLVKAKKLLSTLDSVDMKLLKDHAHMTWMKESKNLKNSLKKVLNSKNISIAREGFEEISNVLVRVAKTLGTSGKLQVYRYHCPMAFGGRGAIWLQNKRGTENPYFGTKMFKCGSMVETISESAMIKGMGVENHE